jgi:hypothetical protein
VCIQFWIHKLLLLFLFFLNVYKCVGAVEEKLSIFEVLQSKDVEYAWKNCDKFLSFVQMLLNSIQLSYDLINKF